MIPFRKKKKKGMANGSVGFVALKQMQNQNAILSIFLHKNPIFPITKLAVIGDPTDSKDEIYFVSLNTI